MKKANNAKDVNAQAHSDLAALNRRAQRFQREHEIERQKGLHPVNGPPASSSYHPYANQHLYKHRVGTPAVYDTDDPEANPVSLPPVPLLAGACGRAC